MKFLEKVFAVCLVLMAICFLFNLVFIKPDYSGILSGCFLPKIPQTAYSASVALVGSVIMPHNLYLHSALVLTRKIKRDRNSQVQIALRYYNLETAVTLLGSFFINLTVISTFAHFKIDAGKQEELDLSTAAAALATTFGSKGKYVWAVGLLAAGNLSTISGTLAGQYVMQGYLGIHMSKWKRATLTRVTALAPAFLLVNYLDARTINQNLNIL